MYLVLIPIILFKKKLFRKFFIKNNFILIIFLSISLLGNITTNYLSTGCFLYPAEKTCIGNYEWSIPKKDVKKMKVHYEWWAKAGGGPGYRSEIPKEIYVKNFNWLTNWIERHFFNKVSDTLFGLIFAYSLVYFSFNYFSKSRSKKDYKTLNISLLILPVVFLLEWFLFHPAMRYGGYVLIALPLIIFTSLMMDKLNLDKKKITSLTMIFLIISISTYFGRNILRINKEINFYNYKLINSPFFFVEDVESIIVSNERGIKIYSPADGKMCWASKTPCSYHKQIKIKDFKGLKMVYRDDW